MLEEEGSNSLIITVLVMTVLFKLHVKLSGHVIVNISYNTFTIPNFDLSMLCKYSK